MKRTTRRAAGLGLFVWIAVFAAFAARAQADGRALAEAVAAKSGAAAWDKVRRVRFTWTHKAKNVARGYDWDRAAKTIAVTMDGKTTVVPENGDPGDGSWSDEKAAAHKAFINDWYWFAFELRAASDAGVTLTDLGELDVPGFAKLGKTRGLKVSYGENGGYTPGDAYVLYVNDESVPVAWSYYPGGAAEPRLTVTREARTEAAGLSLPTRFVAADGAVVIEITGVTLE